MLRAVLSVMLITTALPAVAADDPLVAQATELLGKAVAFRTVKGQGQVPAYASHIAGVLVAAGFARDDITITPMGETATLVARWRGSGAKKPMLLAGHMDVVEADPKDWQRFPFKMERDEHYLYGRGILDNKFDVTMMVATLAQLRREGFKPNRDIILVLSGDEETEQTTTAVLAKQFPDADFLLNGDAGGATLGDDGKPIAYGLQAAEKTYADFAITVTDPGGHSSRPTGRNAIVELAKIIERIGAYQFPAQQSALTKAYFAEVAKTTPGDLGAAMRGFAANASDEAAIARLSRESEYVGQVRTTCVPTMATAGHAPNALPQRAMVNVNCRIFPGVAVEDVRKRLVDVSANDKAEVKLVGGAVTSDASPLRKDVLAAVRRAVDGNAKNLQIVPQMSPGTTDSLYFRNVGIASYGISGMYMKPSDDYAHGLNERVPIDAIPRALRHYRILIASLAK